MARSMTGFSRQDISADWGDLAVEMRAVNHRYLEMSIRVPEELRALDPAIRKRVAKFINRGKLDINFRYSPQLARQNDINLNPELVDILARTSAALAGKFGGEAMTAADVLRWPGVVMEPERDLASIQKTAMELLDSALQDLVASRSGEGERLAVLLLSRCQDITALVTQVRDRLPEVRKHIREKLHARLDALDVSADEGRLETEIALLLNKADVDEELDRLDSHVTETRDIVAADGAIGRRLDFLMQEFNREANTLSSKSQDTVTTKLAVELKVLIEQMREQVQNIE
ncbi:MAG: YicC family protein [Gammaproteobacteria bacterium]|nr:YicC family protein [Gammaproteobacteria bacterium]